MSLFPPDSASDASEAPPTFRFDASDTTLLEVLLTLLDAADGYIEHFTAEVVIGSEADRQRHQHWTLSMWGGGGTEKVDLNTGMVTYHDTPLFDMPNAFDMSVLRGLIAFARQEWMHLERTFAVQELAAVMDLPSTTEMLIALYQSMFDFIRLTVQVEGDFWDAASNTPYRGMLRFELFQEIRTRGTRPRYEEDDDDALEDNELLEFDPLDGEDIIVKVPEGVMLRWNTVVWKLIRP